MAYFSWLDFCIKHNIPYVMSGPNVSSGTNINISCPFCGNDPSNHMGLSLESTAWGCWRSHDHRGRRPHRLIMILIGCSYRQACEIVGDAAQTDISSFDSFMSDPVAFFNNTSQHEITKIPKLKFPREIRKFNFENPTHVQAPYVNYLINARKFSKKTITEFIKYYGIRYAISGDWRRRIIFPVFYDKTLITWTGRCIDNSSSIKYKTLSPKSEKAAGGPQAIAPISNTLLNYNAIAQGGTVLVITEGPLDAVKVDMYGKKYGVRATCLFTKNASFEQKQLLLEIGLEFDKVVIMLDANEISSRIRLQNDLAQLQPIIVNVPFGMGDPGELSKLQVRKLARKLLTL